MNSERLQRAYIDLRAALAPLGIEIGPDTFALWVDRERHGRDALPPEVLERLAVVVEQLAGHQ